MQILSQLLTVARGFICGEGIYPRWAAKQPQKG